MTTLLTSSTIALVSPNETASVFQTCLTVSQVIGYSYKDTHNPGPANTGKFGLMALHTADVRAAFVQDMGSMLRGDGFSWL